MKNGDVGGQPDRFYVTADGRCRSPPTSSTSARTWPGSASGSRRPAAIGLHDGFPEYGRDFRRRLGIESEQAMELFHQTVSMKSVGNLTDFVREHMLEPFNAAQATRDIVAHFDHLTSAHEAVLRAQAQLDALTPLLAGLRRARPAGRAGSPTLTASARRCATTSPIQGAPARRAARRT